MHARLCARPRGNGSRSLNRAADWCQVEISVAFPGASVARYLQRASFLEPKRRRRRRRCAFSARLVCVIKWYTREIRLWTKRK